MNATLFRNALYISKQNRRAKRGEECHWASFPAPPEPTPDYSNPWGVVSGVSRPEFWRTPKWVGGVQVDGPPPPLCHNYLSSLLGAGMHRSNSLGPLQGLALRILLKSHLHARWTAPRQKVASPDGVAALRGSVPTVRRPLAPPPPPSATIT